MKNRKMPNTQDLAERYASLEGNERLHKIANWKLPNCAEPQDDEAFLQFLDDTGPHYHEVLDKVFARIQIKERKQPA